MKKETIKTAILALLILNCVQLMTQIWMSEKLWPSGYNFFRSVEQTPIIGRVAKWLGGPEQMTGSMLYQASVQPRRVVLNGGGNMREDCAANHPLYYKAVEYAKEIVAPLFQTTPRSAPLSTEQWYSFFKGKSIYVDFGFPVDGVNLAQLCGVTPQDDVTGFPVVTGLLITPDTVTGEVAVCVRDENSGVVTRYWSPARGDELQRYIEKLPLGKQEGYAYAFELSLDRPITETGMKQMVVLEPMVLLHTTPATLGGVHIQNELEDKETISQKADKIVTAFGYTPSSLRKSITAEGEVSYVENSGTVTVSTSGLASYQAVTRQQGIELGTARPTAQQMVNGVLGIVKQVWETMGIDNMPDVQLTSALVETKEGGKDGTVVSFDYCYNGVPVVVRSQDGMPSIYAEVRDGRIQTLQMMLCTLEGAHSKQQGTPVLEAIDLLFEQHQDAVDSVKINRIFECYTPGARAGTLAQVTWGLEIEGRKGYVITP